MSKRPKLNTTFLYESIVHFYYSCYLLTGREGSKCRKGHSVSACRANGQETAGDLYKQLCSKRTNMTVPSGGLCLLKHFITEDSYHSQAYLSPHSLLPWQDNGSTNQRTEHSLLPPLLLGNLAARNSLPPPLLLGTQVQNMDLELFITLQCFSIFLKLNSTSLISNASYPLAPSHAAVHCTLSHKFPYFCHTELLYWSHIINLHHFHFPYTPWP